MGENKKAVSDEPQPKPLPEKAATKVIGTYQLPQVVDNLNTMQAKILLRQEVDAVEVARLMQDAAVLIEYLAKNVLVHYNPEVEIPHRGYHLPHCPTVVNPGQVAGECNCDTSRVTHTGSDTYTFDVRDYG